MENSIDAKLPDFVVKVLNEKELREVAGGMMVSTTGTKSSCDKDGTNDGD